MKNLYKALADFQREVPTILADTQGYGYKYADLNSIFKIINPLLKKHGLGFTQPLSKTSLKTIIFHIESGEYLESEIDLLYNVKLAKMNDFQVMGSQITYLRRYTLSSALGLITDEDADAGGDQDKEAKLPELKPSDTKNWDKVVEALNGNYTLEQIETKWYISDTNKKLL